MSLKSSLLIPLPARSPLAVPKFSNGQSLGMLPITGAPSPAMETLYTFLLPKDNISSLSL